MVKGANSPDRGAAGYTPMPPARPVDPNESPAATGSPATPDSQGSLGGRSARKQPAEPVSSVRQMWNAAASGLGMLQSAAQRGLAAADLKLHEYFPDKQVTSDRSGSEGTQKTQSLGDRIFEKIKKTTGDDWRTVGNAQSDAIAARFARPSPKGESGEPLPDFSGVRSSKLVSIKVQKGTTAPRGNAKRLPREDFLEDASYKTAPPVLAASSFLPEKMIKHLMTNKKNLAVNLKWVAADKDPSAPLDQITNMEAALHTFLTPLVKGHMTSDVLYMGGNRIKAHSHEQKGRPVILSAAIHPDFEKQEKADHVIFRICELGDEAVPGAALSDDFDVPTADEKQDKSTRDAYDEKLRAHMIHHLTTGHSLPSKEQVEVLDFDKTMQAIETALETGTGKDLAGKAMTIDDPTGGPAHVLSLEVLFNLYKEQLGGELLSLERLCPQGYVYTIDPPAFFVGALGKDNNKVLNRLQALALKDLSAAGKLTNLKQVAVANFSDPQAIKSYQAALDAKPDRASSPAKVVKKHALDSDTNPPFLFDRDTGEYIVPEGGSKWALVLHNNSDGFGQNIQHEMETSVDGVIGGHSDFAESLRRDRPDLCNHVLRPVGGETQ